MKCNRDCFNCIYEDCIDTGTDYKKTYYQKNAEKIKARAKQWAKENPERAKEIQKKAAKRYYEKHKKEITLWQSQYHKERYRRLKALKNENINKPVTTDN